MRIMRIGLVWCGVVDSGGVRYGSDFEVFEGRYNMIAISGTIAILIAYGICALMGYFIGVEHGIEKCKTKRYGRR